MQVLHTHWLLPRSSGNEGGLFVWAETAKTPQSKRDRRKKSAQPHSFTLNHGELAPVIRRAIPWHKGQFSKRSVTFWLPTNRFGPAPSPELLHDWEQDDAPLELRPWIVNGIRLNVGDAFNFLVRLKDVDLMGTRLGGDSRTYQYAINLTLEILAQQKLRPTMVEIREGRELRYEARWQPILDGEYDARRLNQLAEDMPAICRADAKNPDETVPPRALLDNFLNHMTDAAAREWGTKRELYLPTSNNPAERWLRALFAANPTVEGSVAQLQHLYSSYRAWTRALTIAGDKHYRVAFRLEAPAQHAKGDIWQLHYLLQARDDASLIVPAAEVWRVQGGVLEALDRRFDRPQERLLTGLGYAGRFFAPIKKSLNRQNPSDIRLTSQEAFEFLRHCAPHLEQSGFGLLTPPWWNKPGTRLGVRLKLSGGEAGPAGVSSGHMSLQNLVKYRWQLSVGDTALTREEFDALVALKSPLVQIRGQWVQLDPEQIEAAIQFWQKQQTLEGEYSLHEAMQLGLGGVETHNGLSVDGVAMDEWLQSWLAKLQGDEKLAVLPSPEGLRATLRPYQQYGYSWLDFARRWGMGVILADDMGLGKTIQTLTMTQKLKNETGRLPVPILLVCPTSVVINWQMESEKFTPGLKTMAHQGSDRLRGDEFIAAAREVDMVLTSYALVRRDAEIMRQVKWLGVALDEAQNIKNPNTKQAQVIRSLTAGFRLALTGTPVENRLSELWSIMQFLNPGYLGGQKTFRKRYALPIEKYGDEEATKKLRELTRPFILRRLKTDPTVITDLPEKQEVKVYCHLSEEQATLYEAVVQDALQAIEDQEEGGIARKGMVLSMLMQLKQVCNHPVQYLHQGETYNPFEDNNRSGKLSRFHAILDEVLAEGDRLLLFSQFTEMGGLLKQYIQERFGVPALFLHGGVRPRHRAEMVRRFQMDDGPPVFVLSLKAGGTGLNLTSANHVFHFDRWWNPAVEDQATDRAFRIGQTRNVLVHKFVCLGTLEERIDGMIEDKKALAESIVGKGENWLTEMTTADLRHLVQLRN
jgi:SNF2 family DNA or RNA helicase